MCFCLFLFVFVSHSEDEFDIVALSSTPSQVCIHSEISLLLFYKLLYKMVFVLIGILLENKMDHSHI